jgi:hypothetical protein
VRRQFLCLIVVLSMLISEGSERSRKLTHMAPEIPRAVNQDSTHFSGKHDLPGLEKQNEPGLLRLVTLRTQTTR